jgi:hypothetical protein
MAASGAAAAIVLDVLLLVLVLGGEALLFADGSRSRRGSSPRVPQRGAPVPTRQVARQNGPREAESCLFLLFLLNALKSLVGIEQANLLTYAAPAREAQPESAYSHTTGRRASHEQHSCVRTASVLSH